MHGRFVAVRHRATLAAVACGCLLTAFGCAGLARKERELVFRIEPGVARWYDGVPADLREMDLPVPSVAAQSVHAWWWPSPRTDAPAVLYLHGSRWNLTGQLFRIRELHDLGFSVFAIDYRGFGRSAGDPPSEKAVYADARVGWDAMSRLVPDPKRRYLYGHSLGGAIAVDLAATLSNEATEHDAPVPAAGLVIESSFTSLADIARALSYRWLPIELVLTQKFDSVDRIRDVRMPVVVLHGDADRYVPLALGKALYDAAPQPKRFVVVENGTHNDSLRRGERAVGRAFDEVFGLRLPTS